MFVTSDAATILKELEVAHPAANMIVMASKNQEEEIGDGSNLCVVFAGEILFLATGLLRMGMHVSDIVKVAHENPVYIMILTWTQGYERASAKAMEILPTLTVSTLANFTSEKEIAECLKGVVASKQYGYEDFLCALIAKACVLVSPSSLNYTFVHISFRSCPKIPRTLLWTMSEWAKSLVSRFCSHQLWTVWSSQRFLLEMSSLSRMPR